MKILKRPVKIRASLGITPPPLFLELQKLYPIVPATRTDRSWWKKMKKQYGKSEQDKVNTIKYCPGIFDFSNCGYIVPCLHDMKFYVNKNQDITWQMPEGLPPGWIGVHNREQIDSCPISHGKNTGAGIVKVMTPWYWETAKGWSTIITKPFYNYSNDFDVCPGIMDSDLNKRSNHLINIFLRFNVIEKEIVFRAGQPLCQLIPFERQNTKLTITEEASEEQKKTIQRETAAMTSRLPDNHDKGITLLDFRDPTTKKYE